MFYFHLQNFEPVPYPKGDYGKFFTGDSYIVLNVSHFNVTISNYNNVTDKTYFYVIFGVVDFMSFNY